MRTSALSARRTCRALMLCVATLSAGCFGREAPSLKSNDPSLKIPAIKLAVERHDLAATAYLVKSLDSDDPAIRFYSIQGLQRLTGQTLGYRYYDDELDRREALSRWKTWLAACRDAGT